MSQYTLNPPIRNYYAGTQNNSRFYIRSNVYLPNSEFDPQTGTVREVQRRPVRTQALRRELKELDNEYARYQEMLKARANEKGLRMSLKSAVGLIAAAFIVLCVILLVQQGNIIAKKSNLTQMTAKITATQHSISSINTQIDEASDEVQICYTAAQDLDMVPGESAQAIYLNALSTRPNQEPIAIRAGN